jgi:hypothetical protein
MAVTLGLLLLVFELVRRKRLSERYAILWLIAGATLLLLAVWKGLLTSLSHDVGIYYPPSALFAVAIGLIIMILLHFSLVVSRLSDQNKILAQRLGLLQQRVEEEEYTQSLSDEEGGRPLPESADVGAEQRSSLGDEELSTAADLHSLEVKTRGRLDG